LAQGRQAVLKHLQAEGFELVEGAFLSAFKRSHEKALRERVLDGRERLTSSLFREVMSESGYPALPAAAVEAAMQHFYRPSEWAWRPVPGMSRVLDQLATRGYLLGLVSNAGDAPNVHRLLAKADLESSFDPVLVSASVGLRKPQPGIFERLLEAWGLAPEQVVMVGDSLEEDVLGANRVGMWTIWVRGVAGASRELSEVDAPPDSVAETLLEVPGLVESLAVRSKG
jgi:HAD superfamily hydrolase (TIGR01662 family)